MGALNAADDEEIAEVAARKTLAMDLERVGMEREFVEADKLLQVDVDRKVQPAFVDGALFQSAGYIAKRLPDVGGGELDAILLKRIGQEPQGLFLHGAFARIRIGRLVVVGLLVLLCHGLSRHKQGCYE